MTGAGRGRVSGPIPRSAEFDRSGLAVGGFQKTLKGVRIVRMPA